MNRGLSIILCCHNSTSRLEPTLDALLRQDIEPGTPCELVLVDNASTDGTASFARSYWEKSSPPFKIRIVFEANPGLMHARLAGINAARYAYILFCDDDNHLSQSYAQEMIYHLDSSNELAAVGGTGIPLFENEPPKWFKSFESSFATGSQQCTRENDRVLNLYGAGLALKKHVLQRIYGFGYKPVLTGRKGKSLNSAEDTEMTYAMVIGGYTLSFDDSLEFQHFMPKERMTKDYLEKLILSSGEDGPIRNLYHAYASNSLIHQWMRNWFFHLSVCIFRFPKYLLVPPKTGFRMLFLRWNLAYIKSLWNVRTSYRLLRENIHRIPHLDIGRNTPATIDARNAQSFTRLTHP